jgi:hypothetical protein
VVKISQKAYTLQSLPQAHLIAENHGHACRSPKKKETSQKETTINIYHHFIATDITTPSREW